MTSTVNFSCFSDQKEITIDETYCWSTDHLGRPIDIYSDPDYRMQCIGYWKENLKSYLITYDQLDAFTKYRCWVRKHIDFYINKYHSDINTHKNAPRLKAIFYLY